jgi:DNA processing protein
VELAVWALTFTLLPWPESRKAAAWSSLQAGEEPLLGPGEREELEALGQSVPRLREEAERRGARLALPGEPDVDRLLAPLPYPVALWVRGTLPPDQPALAMVGSRQGSRLGKERTRRWAHHLTAAGVAVLSGLARGIDGAAHEGALEAGCTWGIMGSGLDEPYPPEHRGLMDRIAASGGGIITPFPPPAPPRKWHFPRRNVLLAAWSLGVVVMEARYASGSLVTAKLALDLGKELWACPGTPEVPLYDGPNRLIREGAARACLGPQDIIYDLYNFSQGLTNHP